MRLLLLALAFFSTAASASFSGQLKSSTDYYPEDLGAPTDTLVPYLSLDLNGKYKFTKKFRFQWKAYGLSNPESEEMPEQLYGDVQEGFFEYKMKSLRLRLGINTINWGVVDLASPSDVVNSQAFFHPLRTIKRGAPMVEFDWDKEAFGLHAIYIPVQRKGVLPSTDSRWLPRTLLLNTNTEFGRVHLPDVLEYQYEDDEVLENGETGYTLSRKALAHNAGLRLSSRFGGLDLFAMHFEGAAPQPKAHPYVTIVGYGSDWLASSPIRLAPVYYRVRTSSAGFVWAFEKWILRGESAYQHTLSRNELLQPWSWSSVLAVETNVDVGSKSITLLGQYYYSQNPQAADNVISSSYRLFDRTGVLGMRIPISDDTTVIASGLYETKTKGVFAMLAFENKLSDSMRWGLGWRDFSAQEDGLIKTYDKNDHATLDLTYYF